MFGYWRRHLDLNGRHNRNTAGYMYVPLHEALNSVSVLVFRTTPSPFSYSTRAPPTPAPVGYMPHVILFVSSTHGITFKMVVFFNAYT